MADEFILAEQLTVGSNRDNKLRTYKLRKSQEENRNDPFDNYTELQFKQRFRFRKETVRNITYMLHDDLVRRTRRSFAMAPLLQVLMALRFLSTGTFCNVVGDTLQISSASVCRIVKRVCRSILSRMSCLVTMPSVRASMVIKHAFQALAGFPNIIGCIDGTFIKIQKPAINTKEFICRKGFAAINVQIMNGPDMYIYDSIVKWPGTTHDARMFRGSDLKKTLELSEH